MESVVILLMCWNGIIGLYYSFFSLTHFDFKKTLMSRSNEISIVDFVAKNLLLIFIHIENSKVLFLIIIGLLALKLWYSLGIFAY